MRQKQKTSFSCAKVVDDCWKNSILGTINIVDCRKGIINKILVLIIKFQNMTQFLNSLPLDWDRKVLPTGISVELYKCNLKYIFCTRYLSIFLMDFPEPEIAFELLRVSFVVIHWSWYATPQWPEARRGSSQSSHAFVRTGTHELSCRRRQMRYLFRQPLEDLS